MKETKETSRENLVLHALSQQKNELDKTKKLIKKYQCESSQMDKIV